MFACYSQSRKLLCLLALAFLFVACGSDQAAARPTPTATPTATVAPTPTPTPTPVPTVQPAPTPDLSPPWTLSPNPLLVQGQGCKNFGNYVECVLKITYNSQGAVGDASWSASMVVLNGAISLSPAQGTMTAPTSSVNVLVDISVLYCQGGGGNSIRISFTSPIPEDDQFVPVNCTA